MNTSPGPTAGEPNDIDRKELLEAMDASFSLEELSTLCFSLGIDIDNLEGAGKRGKARELIEYCLRSSRVHELLALCKEERSEVDWDAFVRPAGGQEAPDGGTVEPEGQPEEEKKRRVLMAVAAVAVIAVIALILWASGVFSSGDDELPVPAVSFRESALEVDEEGGAAEFTVELSGSHSNTITIPYETSDVSATAGEDYEATQGVLTFAPNEVEKTIPVPVLADDLNGEEDESLKLVLTDLEERPVEATLTIKDHPSPNAGLRVPDLEVAESQGMAEFMVEIGGGWTKAVTILYETSGGTADAVDDYEERSGVLIFNPGDSERPISVPIRLDWLGDEGDETVGLVFRNSPDSEVELPGLPLTATLTIKDHPLPTARFLDNALEVDESQNLAEFTVEFAGSWPDPVTVSYETKSGSATAGEDYKESGGVLTFVSDGDRQPIPIPVLLDTLASEGDETLRLILRNDPNSDTQLPGLPLTATLTIKDHPPPTARLALNALEVDEDQGKAELVVELTGSWPDPVSVTYETSPGTATAGQDYGETRGEVTFDPGDTAITITIPITNDVGRELDETLNLTIGDAPTITIDSDSNLAVVTIRDDGDTESACSLRPEDRVTPDLEIVTLSFEGAVFLRSGPEEADNRIDSVREDQVLCVIDRDGGWYRVRLIDTVTDGWIGESLVQTVTPPRLQFEGDTARIPFWDADSETACQRGDVAVGRVADITEADILRFTDRSGDDTCFKVQLTIGGREGWVQSVSFDTFRAARVAYKIAVNSVFIRDAPGGEKIPPGDTRGVEESQILWASEAGRALNDDGQCRTWYRVILKDGGEGWIGGRHLLDSDALEWLRGQVDSSNNYC